MRFMAQNNFPMHLNSTEVADCDRDAFERSLVQQLGDIDGGIPDDWAA
jgi:hypothetical protein